MPHSGYQAYSETVAITNRVNMESALGYAVDRAIAAAVAIRDGGILVTRHSQTTFTVALCESVPFGTTEELDLS